MVRTGEAITLLFVLRGLLSLFGDSSGTTRRRAQTFEQLDQGAANRITGSLLVLGTGNRQRGRGQCPV